MKDYKEAKLELGDLAPNKVRWFSIAKDGYPPFNGAVLVTGRGKYCGAFVDVMAFTNGDWYGVYGIQTGDNIVSWALLPEPSEEGTRYGTGVDKPE